MPKFTEVLKNRNFFLLWIGQIISQLGDRLDQMALIGLVYLRTQGGAGSTMEIAKILSFTIIPVFLIGPIAGVYVDRWDRRRTLYVCDFLRAALIFTIPFFLFYSKSYVPIYIVVFLAFCIGRFFIPAKLAIVPDLVNKNQLLIANSLVNTTGMIAAVLGFGISGLLVQWKGPKIAFYLDSLSFFISAVLIFLINKKTLVCINLRRVGKEIVEVIRKSVLQEIKDGIVYFAQKKQIGLTAAVTFILFSALGAVYVVIIVFVQNTLHSVTSDLGLMAMFLGLGLFFGSMLYGRFGHRVSDYKSIFVSLALSGGMLVAFAITISRFPFFLIAVLLSLVLGILIAPIMIASNTIIHKVSESQMRGKIFSSLEIIMHLGFLLFMFVSSLLAEKSSHLIILVSVGALVTILGLVSLSLKRKIAWLD